MSLKGALRVWEKLPGEYRRRWGIETGYRVDGGFRARTTIRDERLRFIYCGYMVFLENLWTLYNMREVRRQGVVLDEVKKLSVTGKMFCEDFVHVLVTTFDRGPL